MKIPLKQYWNLLVDYLKPQLLSDREACPSPVPLMSRLNKYYGHVYLRQEAQRIGRQRALLFLTVLGSCAALTKSSFLKKAK